MFPHFPQVHYYANVSRHSPINNYYKQLPHLILPNRERPEVAQPVKPVGTCQSAAGKLSLFLLQQPRSGLLVTVAELSVGYLQVCCCRRPGFRLGAERVFNGCRDSINVPKFPANCPKITRAYISETQLVTTGCLFLWAGQRRSTYLSKAKSFTKPQSFCAPTCFCVNPSRSSQRSCQIQTDLLAGGCKYQKRVNKRLWENWNDPYFEIKAGKGGGG